MKCIDTIATPLTKIDALAIHDDFLWVIPDSSISERVSYEQISEDTFDSLRYRSYYIYKINPDSGLIVDSVAFEVSAGGPADTNFILGLEVYNDEFIVAINGGFGPCVLFVELQKPHKVRSGCCSHPMGMVRIGNEIFAVRFGGKALIKLVQIQKLYQIRLIIHFLSSQRTSLTMDIISGFVNFPIQCFIK